MNFQNSQLRSIHRGVPLRLNHLSLSVLLLVNLSCTSQPPKTESPTREVASAESDAIAQMCGKNDAVSDLYESLIGTTCSVNYAWELIGGPITDDKMLNCAALYMGGGSVVAAAGKASQLKMESWSRNLRGERTMLVRNTALARKDMGILMENPILVKRTIHDEIRFSALQRQFETWGNLKADFETTTGKSAGERIERILAKYPHNYIRYHYITEVGDMHGSTLAVTKGPNRMALQASKVAFRLGLLSTGVGVVMIAADTLLGATATACDERVHAFYEANRDDYCKPVNVAGPNVIGFLQQTPEEQLNTLKEFPMLCPIYTGIAQTQVEENKQKFGTKEISYQCAGGKTNVDLVFDNGLKSEVELSGLKARIRNFGATTDVEYRKNENGRVSVAAITWRSGYGGSRPIKYKFPEDLDKAGEQRFQNLFQQVAKTTLALEGADLFSQNCQ